MDKELYVVRLYDGFDNEWMDICKPCSYKQAHRIWNERTENGTKKTTFNDIDYFRIFPANTVMHFSEEGRRYRNMPSKDQPK